VSENVPWRVAFCSNLQDGLLDIPVELQALHAKFGEMRLPGGWRKVGSILGISGAYARELALREKPLTTELIERWLLFTGRVRRYREVLACPDCGDAHTGRCHGKPVTRVQIISAKPRIRRRYHRPCMDDAQYAAYLEWRKEQHE
jgi:hypothetical protein